MYICSNTALQEMFPFRSPNSIKRNRLWYSRKLEILLWLRNSRQKGLTYFNLVYIVSRRLFTYYFWYIVSPFLWLVRLVIELLQEKCEHEIRQTCVWDSPKERGGCKQRRIWWKIPYKYKMSCSINSAIYCTENSTIEVK